MDPGFIQAQREIGLAYEQKGMYEYLAEDSGRLVSEDELIQAVWPDTFVSDNSLVQCLIDLRP